MKKQYLILCILMGTLLKSYSQNILITDLSTSSVAKGINVNVKAKSGTGSGYLSNSYTINGNVIDLSVCYWFDNTLPVLHFDNDFLVPLPITGDYTINVHIILSSSQTECDYYANTDNRTISASYLSRTAFDSIKEEYTFFPNPTNGKIRFKGIESTPIDEIKVFDSLGRLVKEFKAISSNPLDLDELHNGVYLIKTQIGNTSLNQKIIVKK